MNIRPKCDGWNDIFILRRRPSHDHFGTGLAPAIARGAHIDRTHAQANRAKGIVMRDLINQGGRLASYGWMHGASTTEAEDRPRAASPSHSCADVSNGI